VLMRELSSGLVAIRIFWVVGALCAALTACAGSGSTGTTAEPATSTASAQKPPGGPAPAELQGDWLSLSDANGLPPIRLSIHATSYRAGRGGGGGAGQIVVRGDEIDLFNSALCGLYLPEGVGRYRWKISGDMLELHVIEKDPCGSRASGVDATFKRAG
jgi:hypothetical protein